MINKKTWHSWSFVFIMIIVGCIFLFGCNKTEPFLKINTESLNEILYVNDRITLSGETEEGVNTGITWSVNNSAIAKVEGNSLILLTPGDLTITATHNDLTENYVCKVEYRKPESLKIDVKSYSIYMGETLDLKAILTPANAYDDILWTVYDDQQNWECVEFNGTSIKAIKYGKVYITAQSKVNYQASDTVVIDVLHPLVDKEVYEAKYIAGLFGEDASTSYGIQYHIQNLDSYALVTTADDVNFENATPYYGDGYYFEFGDDPEGIGYMEGRNVWRINITDLEPNTEYIYKINNGNDTYSEVHHFKTAGGDSTTSFLFLTDIHYYEASDGSTASAAVSEEIVKEALKLNPNISFIMNGGDLVDTGGDESNWDKLFTYGDMIRKLPLATVPGNHEYYADMSGISDNSYMKIYNPAPLNAPSAQLGASAYFKHNDTIIFLIDNQRRVGYQDTIDWMKEKLETEEYEYSIIMLHAPCHMIDSDDYDPLLLDVCDKYSVDLVLAGHYHSQRMDQYIYEDVKTTDPYLGTSFLNGAFSGIKSSPTPQEAINFARGYIMDVTDEGIKIQTIYANGKLGPSWTATNRKSNDYVETDKEELINSISYEYKEDTKQITFNWSRNFYGNVKKVYIKETLRGKISDYSVFPTSSYTSLTLDGITPGYDYNFEVKIIFKDGSEEIRNYGIALHKPLDITFTNTTATSTTVNITPLEGAFRFEVSKFKVYVDNVLVGEFKYLNNAMADVTSYVINNIDTSKNHKIELVATDRNDTVIYFAEETEFKK
ncbi:MAG: metallophosphoesterase [Bacilli bacterium]|nr:metallophosphoesterase [Bacilli bacterium]